MRRAWRRVVMQPPGARRVTRPRARRHGPHEPFGRGGRERDRVDWRRRAAAALPPPRRSPMSKAEAGSEAVQRLDSLYEFERAPVTRGPARARLVLRRPVLRGARRRDRVRDRRPARQLRGERHGHRPGPPPRQPPRGAVLDLRLRPDRGVDEADPLLVPAAHRRAGGDAPLQPLQRGHVLHPRGGDDHRLGLGRAPALRHPRADEVVPGGPALRPRWCWWWGRWW